MMRIHVSPLMAAAAFAVAAIFGFVASPGHSTETTGQRHVIEIRNLKFHPEKITVAPGDTVVWINKDIIPHTATADDESWDSQEVGVDEQWEMVIQEGMSSSYFCQFHPSMKGQLEIAKK